MMVGCYNKTAAETNEDRDVQWLHSSAKKQKVDINTDF